MFELYRIQLRLLIAVIPIPMPRVLAVDRHKRLALTLHFRPCEPTQSEKMVASVKLAVHLIKQTTSEQQQKNKLEIYVS